MGRGWRPRLRSGGEWLKAGDGGEELSEEWGWTGPGCALELQVSPLRVRNKRERFGRDDRLISTGS